jgi:hypothetical protein
MRAHGPNVAEPRVGNGARRFDPPPSPTPRGQRGLAWGWGRSSGASLEPCKIQPQIRKEGTRGAAEPEVSDGEWRQGRLGSGRSCPSPLHPPHGWPREASPPFATRPPPTNTFRQSVWRGAHGGRAPAGAGVRDCIGRGQGERGGRRSHSHARDTPARAGAGLRGAEDTILALVRQCARVPRWCEVGRGEGRRGEGGQGGDFPPPLVRGRLPRVGGRPRSAPRLHELFELRELRRGAP